MPIKHKAVSILELGVKDGGKHKFYVRICQGGNIKSKYVAQLIAALAHMTGSVGNVSPIFWNTQNSMFTLVGICY